MTEQQVVRHGHGIEGRLATRRVLAQGVPRNIITMLGLADRHPVLDPIGETFAHDRGVLGKALDGVAVEPATLIFQSLREVPSGRAATIGLISAATNSSISRS
ncbi:MAG: hypothetical protein V9G04_18015 [Nocardioides sp.]